MAQEVEHDMPSTLGKVWHRPDGTLELHQFRTVSDQEAEQLQASSRLVRQLGSQRDFKSLVQAVGRWLQTIERVRERLAAGKAIPKAVLVSAALDLAAMARASARCEQSALATANSLLAEGHADATHTAAIDTARRFLQTRQAYLVCSALAEDDRSGAIELVLVDSAVRIARHTAFDAAALGYTLLAEVGQFVVSTTGALADAIAEPARELEALLDEVPDGIVPDLVRVDGGDHPSRATFAALPIVQAVALHRFSEQLEALTPDQYAQALFAVIDADVHQQIEIGSVDVSSASEDSRANTAVNELPHAEVTLDVDLLGSAPIDFWSAVTFDVIGEGTGQRLFAGAVQDASGRESLVLDCEGAVELAEHNRGTLVAAEVDTAELLRTIMRQIGLPEDTISLSGSEQHPRTQERFEVFVPVRGLAVISSVRVGRITIAPVPDGQQPLEALNLTEEHVRPLADEYRNATAYAVASVDADALDSAEEQGYAAVETTMAWLVTRQRYGSLRLPDGTTQTFSRAHALQHVRYGPVVLVRGEKTRRQWLRWTHNAGRLRVTDLTDESEVMRPALPEDLDPADERALRALMRAVNEPGLQQQVLALSEALEAYVAGVEVPRLFSKAQCKELRKQAPDWLSAQQKDKFEKAIDGINTPPFGVRLSERLDRDGVPLTDEERGLLFDTLRSARNDVAHGRAVEQPPTRDEVLRGISVVSRALLFSITAQGRSRDERTSA
jgi:hypothetical protein